MSPEEPQMDWRSVTERATNQLFFLELIRGYFQFTISCWELRSSL